MTTTDLRPSPAGEGWRSTEKYGDVFVTPDGTAWAIRIFGNELKSVPVVITAHDIVKTPTIERLKHAQVMRRLRKSRGSITKPPRFATH